MPPSRDRPKVEVIDTAGKDYLVITRGDGRKCTSHEIRNSPGGNANDRIVNIVTDLLNDRRIAEHLP